MDCEIVLNNEDTTCQHCGSELPRGIHVTIDKLAPQDGTFCDKSCWSEFYEQGSEDDSFED